MLSGRHDNATRLEQRRHSDLVLLGVANEDLAFKVAAFLRLSYRRWRATYRWYAKCDDDTYVVIPQLHRELILLGANATDGYYGVACGDSIGT